MLDTKELVKEIFIGAVQNDIVSIMQENYRKINKKEVREDLYLGNGAIATNFSDANWACFERYAKDKNLGEVKKTHNNKKRWFVNGLTLTINKVDEKLRPCKLYTDDSNQQKLGLEDIILDITVDNPLVIGYIPIQDRTLIKAIHIIKYKKDGSVDWSLPLYKYNEIETNITKTANKDTKSIIKIKTDNKKVVALFDRDK